MTITILALIFLLFMLFITYVGFRFLGGRSHAIHRTVDDHCTLCQARFPRSGLIERQVGDSRIYRFCDPCIRSLHKELIRKN